MYSPFCIAYQLSDGKNPYEQVVKHNVPLLAVDLYEKIRYIRSEGLGGDIELVGHSVGSHVAGQAGDLLEEKRACIVKTIYGNIIS